MLLSYQLALLAADSDFFERSLRQVGLDAGLAGALLLELALSGCVTVSSQGIAVRPGDFADPLLNDVARSIAGRVPAAPVRILADVEGWSGGVRRNVFQTMATAGLVRVEEGAFDSLRIKGRRFGGPRIVVTSIEPRAGLLAALSTARQSYEMTDDIAALMSLALASGVWRPDPPEPYPLTHENSLARRALGRIPMSTREGVEAVVQGVAARTLRARTNASVGGPGA